LKLHKTFLVSKNIAIHRLYYLSQLVGGLKVCVIDLLNCSVHYANFKERL